ncbi:MAG: DNA mismatch repair endonuclease MutL [gamma proteobacterium symbiont of Taylorina sp.]|nr:DNA mismatch repair endonuclease MutL [gamma proteobacterium symbiont of Taylorina sp.]
MISHRIKPLSLQLSNQIAAGEVVERPASVVKELLENAIDAQADSIEIEIERGGSSLIRITDNGDGIEKDDLSLAVTRHATSKLQSLNELEQIISLGFRGEALASISAVSKLSLKSKPVEQEQAWMIDTGTESDFADYFAEPEPTAHPNGSCIEVRDLFYNTPARRKFMRTVKTEFKHIDEVVKRIALGQFNIAFKLSHNKKIIRQLAKAVTEKAINQRISKLFSPDFLSHTHKVDYESNHFSDMGKIHLWGWLSTSDWYRNQTDWQYFYVNGRYIKDKLVNHALRQAYQDLLPADTYSAYILYLEIDPHQVDVNVHPTKHEVRFRQTRLVHDFIYSALNQVINEQAQNSLDINAEQHKYSDKSRRSINSSAVVLQTSSPANKTVEEFVFDKSHPLASYQHNASNRNFYQTQKYPLSRSVKQNHVAEQIEGLQKLYQTDPVDISKQKNSEKKILEDNQTNTLLSFFGQSLGCLIPGYLLTHKVQTNEIFVIHINKAQQFLLTQLFKKGQSNLLLIPESLILNQLDLEILLQYQLELSEWGLEYSQSGVDTILIRALPTLYEIPACKINIEILMNLFIRMIKNSKNSIDANNLLVGLKKSLISRALNPAEQKQLLDLLTLEIGQNEQLIKEPSVWVTLDESILEKMLRTGQ